MGQQITLGEPSVFCLIAHTPDIIFSLASVLTQKLPRKGQFFLDAVVSATLDLSEAAYPKNSAIYPAISVIFYNVMKTFSYCFSKQRRHSVANLCKLFG